MPATGKEAVSLKQAKAMYDRIVGDLTNQTDRKIQGAVAAEAEARKKADQLLEAEVDGKLDAADLVAGENVTITPDPESGHVTIAANVPDTSAFVTKTAADAAYQPKGSYAAASHTHTVSQITDFPEIPEIALATDAEAKGFLGY